MIINDPIEIVLAFTILILSVLLFVVGIYIIKILKEFRISMQKINKILDDSGRITQAVADPLEQASDLIMGFKKGINLFNTIAGFFKRREDDSSAEQDKEDKDKNADTKNKSQAKESTSSSKKKQKKRFFKKNGKSLKK